MNASEREITGVEDMNGLGSMRDALTKQALTLAEMSAREAEREKARNEARETDGEWRRRMDAKTDRLFAVTDAMKATIAEIPAAIDRQVAAGLKAHIEQSEGTRRSLTAILIVVAILLAMAVAATLEFVDHENTASRLIIILMVIVTLAGWYISARRK